MNDNNFQNVLVYFLSSIRTLILHSLILLVFGFAFLFLFHELASTYPLIFGANIQVGKVDFLAIDLSSRTNTLESFVISYIVGYSLYLLGVWSFRFFRKFELESYHIKKWRIKKINCETPLNRINDAEINEYLEKSPYVADIYTLEKLVSTLTRPIFSSFVLLAFLFSHRYDVRILMISIAIFLIGTGLAADEEVNRFGDQIKKIMSKARISNNSG